MIIKKSFRSNLEGEVGTNDLEAIYVQFNTNHPTEYTGHSISMSDVVELYDESGSRFYYCDRTCFQEIRFEEPQQDVMMNF